MFVNFKISETERAAIEKISKHLQRNKSDALRFIIREYADKVEEEKPRTHRLQNLRRERAR